MRLKPAVLLVACSFAAVLAGCNGSRAADNEVAESPAWSPHGLDLRERPTVDEPAPVQQLERAFAAEEQVDDPVAYEQLDVPQSTGRTTPPQPAARQSDAPQTITAQAVEVPAERRQSQPQPVAVEPVAVTPAQVTAAQIAPAQREAAPPRTTREIAPAPRSTGTVEAAPRAARPTPRPTEAAMPAAREAAQPSTQQPGDPDPFAQTAPRPVRPPLPVDAMVGQVNGRALYASRVLEPLDPALQALGQELSPAAFRARAAELIHGQLVQIVADALILGEAERDLNDAQQQALRAHLSRYRASLLRQGLGSVELTEKMMQEKHGKSLSQMIEDERQRQVVRAYLQQKLFPQLNVSRKMVERYYQDNIDEFQPKPTRTVRLIRVSDKAAAERLGAQLQQGKPFAQVASDPANLYQPSEGGMWGKVTGDKPFRYDELNKAISDLGAGQRSARIEAGDAYWWIYVDSLEQGESRTLQEAQLDIEQALRESQFQRLTREYRDELFETGSYNPLDEMALRIVDIATSRYANLPTR